MDLKEIRYLNQQTLAIVKIISVVISKADNKVLEAKRTYGNDLPEVYSLWEQKKKLWVRKLENSLYMPYDSFKTSENLNKLNDYLNIIENNKELGDYADDPVLQECLGLQLEGELCIPNVQEL